MSASFQSSTSSYHRPLSQSPYQSDLYLAAQSINQSLSSTSSRPGSPQRPTTAFDSSQHSFRRTTSATSTPTTPVPGPTPSRVYSSESTRASRLPTPQVTDEHVVVESSIVPRIQALEDAAWDKIQRAKHTLANAMESRQNVSLDVERELKRAFESMTKLAWAPTPAKPSSEGVFHI
jgi:hypothetical protein